MKKIYYKIYIVWLSLKWIFKFNLGDLVQYKGEVYILTQGVCCPRWNIKKLSDDAVYIKHVHQNNFTKIRTLRNYYRSFHSGYQFYMGYWYNIWVGEGVKPWMRKCKIW